jgi:LPXTG-site transpeptidase (sortase) family protein
MNQKPRLSRQRISLYVAWAILGVGILFLTTTAGYYLYGVKARSDLDNLVTRNRKADGDSILSTDGVKLREITQFTPTPVRSTPVRLPIPSSDVSFTPTPTLRVPSISTSTSNPNAIQSTFPTPTPTPSAVIATYNFDLGSFSPGDSVNAYAWADPLGATQPDPLIKGFKVIDSTSFTDMQVTPATRVVIPEIEVDSEVKGLRVIWLDGQPEYETPKNVVGHIPSTSNPGQQGNGWYFGHLESPLAGEGNVFWRLSDIPAMLKDGNEVHVILETEDHQFLYRVTQTDAVHQDELRLTKSDESMITLVTCTRRFFYDFRLLVMAELVGYKSLS